MPIFDKLQGTQAESFIVNSKKKAGDDAALQVDSKTRGFLLPRMTTAQKTAIVAPNNGLEVWDSTLKCISVYRDGAWYCLIDAGKAERWVGVTTGLVDGQLVYVSSNITASPTDARTLAKARCAGVYDGVAGRIRYDGEVATMLFSAASSTPTPGSAVYVAKADDEPADAAAGKATADKPGYPAVPEEVGLVLSVNPITFPATRVAKVLLQIKRIGPVRRYGIAPIGLIDGANTVFTTPSIFDPSTLALYYNGVRMWEGVGNDYVMSESGGPGTGYDTLTTLFTPRAAPGNPDKLMVDYTEI